VTSETIEEAHIASLIQSSHNQSGHEQHHLRGRTEEEVKNVAVKLNYEKPVCPACGTRLTPLKEHVKQQCRSCGWTVLPLNGYDAYTGHPDKYEL
jgi:predicted RNA-binding Zn-ribbon protein involved in translation (DUF1610 family)